MLKPLSKLPAPSARVEVTQKDGLIKLEPSHISVPQPDGSSVPIPTKDVTEATEMLGMFFAPIGNGVPHIEAMREKGFTWADRLMTRPLPSRGAWLSFFLQLYPAISYLLWACLGGHQAVQIRLVDGCVVLQDSASLGCKSVHQCVLAFAL